MIIGRLVLLILTLYTLSPLSVAFGERWLQGRVLENHGIGVAAKPAAGAEVKIVNVGNPYLTGQDGGYRVRLPEAIQEGQTIVLYVRRKGWAIETPIAGELELPKSLMTNIVLLPETSSEFLSPEQLGKLLESLPEKLKSQVKPDAKKGSADPAQVVREYANEHRLQDGEVIARVTELVKQYEQSGDLGKQCLAARLIFSLQMVQLK